MTAFETITLETDVRGIATLTLNRPDKHNALNVQMIAELTEAANALDADSEVRAVILAANGKSFCAGGDLAWMRAQKDQNRAEKMAGAKKLSGMLMTLNNLSKPLIARVHGSAYGGGIGMMAVCDIVIAVAATPFALTETRLGLIPATIGPFVVRRMGEGFARQVFFTARPFDTDLGLRSGLVSRACDLDQLDTFIAEEIAALLKCAPGAVADAKKQCQTLGGIGLVELADRSIELLADRWETDEAQHGIAAFFEKRSAQWEI
jgi:methylglutaconyl-CoA hydratase